MARKKSSSWMTNQNNDPYVIRARQDGYRSRASYKLLEINKADKLFSVGMSVLELGSAPGGWTQVIAQLLGKNAKIVAVDLLDMAPVSGAHFLQGDFRDPAIQAKLRDQTPNNKVNWVISDMAPNLTGVSGTDQARMIDLAYSAWELALEFLAKDGGFLIKMFQGEEVKAFLGILKTHFRQVVIRKPNASRSYSSEIYVLARGFRAELRTKT